MPYQDPPKHYRTQYSTCQELLCSAKHCCTRSETADNPALQACGSCKGSNPNEEAENHQAPTATETEWVSHKPVEHVMKLYFFLTNPRGKVYIR